MTIAAVRSAGKAVAPRLAPSVSFGVGAVLVSGVVFALMLIHCASLPMSGTAAARNCVWPATRPRNISRAHRY